MVGAVIEELQFDGFPDRRCSESSQSALAAPWDQQVFILAITEVKHCHIVQSGFF